MGRFADASWWWEYGLDGLIGGVAGGVVAWGAVWLTLLGTRRQGEIEAAELAVARLQAAGSRTVLAFGLINKVSNSLPPERILDVCSELAATLAESRARVLKRWPRMAAELKDLTDKFSAGSDSPQADSGGPIHAIGHQTFRLATDWLENPNAFRKLERPTPVPGDPSQPLRDT